MVELHLEINEAGKPAFRAGAPEESGAPAVPLRGEALLAAVREVVWYRDGFEEEDPPRDDRLVPTAANLLMFLSDVRGRKFKQGYFLGADVLEAAEIFRQAAEVVAAGEYLPALEEVDGEFYARWRPIGTTGVSPVDVLAQPATGETPVVPVLFEYCLDGLVRLARRTALEDDSDRHDTVHDAWLAALRSDTGRLRWEGAEEARAFMRDLDTWKAPLVVSAEERAAQRFALVPPTTETGTWKLVLAAAPATRLGYISLGQAAALFPPLASMRRVGGNGRDARCPSDVGGNGGDVRCPRGGECVAELDRGGAEAFLRVGAQTLMAAGFSVDMPEGVTGEHLTVEADLSPAESRGGVESGADAQERVPPGSGKIGAKLSIMVDGEKATERELQFLLDQGSTLVFFRDRWIEIDRYALREALRALQSTKAKKLSVREAVSFALGTGHAGRLRVAEVKAHGWLRGLLNELRGEERFHLLEPPEGLNATLRDYQLRGVSWLVFLAKWGFGPCLADDMGLGKTIQVIAWILHLRGAGGGGTPPLPERGVHGRDGVPPPSASPVLVVAPVSVTTNWVREFRRFAPGLKVKLHQGPQRALGGMFRRECLDVDVVVTGYSLLVRDFRLLAEVPFAALVLDEAQMVKNPDTRAAKAARALEAPMKIALTGTPFENSANDLWSLEEVLNPGLLGERKDFEATFTRSIRESPSPRLRRSGAPVVPVGAAAKLRHILEPFMLRRLKTEPGVAAELGEKREVREYCPLSPAQRRRYEEALASFRADAAAEEPSRGRMLALLTELKLVCDGDGKLARLDELLTEIFEQGESCLVFTQYAKVGKMLRAHLQETQGRLFPFLHGGLSPAQREAEIAAFNDDAEPNVFILSLKAGGFGLNLTRATHVIHFDRWWNPAVENQATDRAYRIGQTRTVFVHTFICAGTLEDHIDELLEAKRFLADEVVAGGESFLLKMNAREFERIVQLGGS